MTSNRWASAFASASSFLRVCDKADRPFLTVSTASTREDRGGEGDVTTDLLLSLTFSVAVFGLSICGTQEAGCRTADLFYSEAPRAAYMDCQAYIGWDLKFHPPALDSAYWHDASDKLLQSDRQVRMSSELLNSQAHLCLALHHYNMPVL